jgi:hypothetical protein
VEKRASVLKWLTLGLGIREHLSGREQGEKAWKKRRIQFAYEALHLGMAEGKG